MIINKSKISNTSISAGESNTSIPAGEEFFNFDNEIQIHQANLPHWRQENVWYFVTFRLADSIPSEIAEQIKYDRKQWLKINKKENIRTYSKEQLKEYKKLFSDRIELLLNNGEGSCVLKEKKSGKIIVDALLYFNNKRYILDEWVIMPNHVHLLVKPERDHELSDILHSWKSFTANEINKLKGWNGQLWMHESFDHIVRNEKDFEAFRSYIQLNPERANLSEDDYIASFKRSK